MTNRKGKNRRGGEECQSSCRDVPNGGRGTNDKAGGSKLGGSHAENKSTGAGGASTGKKRERQEEDDIDHQAAKRIREDSATLPHDFGRVGMLVYGKGSSLTLKADPGTLINSDLHSDWAIPPAHCLAMLGVRAHREGPVRGYMADSRSPTNIVMAHPSVPGGRMVCVDYKQLDGKQMLHEVLRGWRARSSRGGMSALFFPVGPPAGRPTGVENRVMVLVFPVSASTRQGKHHDDAVTTKTVITKTVTTTTGTETTVATTTVTSTEEQCGASKQ